MPRKFRQVKTAGKVPLIAVDFDGVIHDYSEGYKGVGKFGPPIRHAVAGMKALQAMGYMVVVYSCRGETGLIIDYLDEHDIPYDAVNEHVKSSRGYKQNPTKIAADLYLDDRNIRFTGSWLDAIQEIESFKLWYGRVDKPVNIGNRSKYETPVDEAANYLKHTTLPCLEAIADRMSNTSNADIDKTLLDSIIDNISSLARLVSNI